MAYVAVGILFLLIAAAFITYLVMTATRRSNHARAKDPSASDRNDTSVPGIGPDRTPLGDTAEHAGEQSASGTTVSDQDAERSGGTGEPAGRTSAPEPHGTPDGRFKRDPVGGEAEGEPATGADVPRAQQRV